MSEPVPDHLPRPAASGPRPRAVLWLGLRVLMWAAVLVLAFAAALWILFATAPEGGGALIGAPLIAMLGPLLISVPLDLVSKPCRRCRLAEAVLEVPVLDCVRRIGRAAGGDRPGGPFPVPGSGARDWAHA